MDTSTLDTTPLSRKRRSDVSDPSEEPPKKVKSLSVLNPNSSAARREKPTPTSSRFYERFEESDWRDVATKKGEQSTKQLLCAVAFAEADNINNYEDVNYFDPETSDKQFAESVKLWKKNSEEARKKEAEKQSNRCRNNCEVQDFVVRQPPPVVTPVRPPFVVFVVRRS